MIKQLTITFLILALPQAFASSPKVIQNKINQAIKQYAPKANVGIIVQTLDNKKVIYQKNTDRLFVPASTLKILPAVAALAFLGPDYFFRTKLLTTDKNIKHGVIRHDIYFYFDGDPTFKYEDFKNLIKQLADLKIKKITNDIYIDDSIFDQELLGSGWMWEDINFCYASPISAIIIDKNCLQLKLLADTKTAKPTLLENTNDQISIINNVVTKNCKNNANNCDLKLKYLNDNGYLLTGGLKPNSKPLALSIAIRDPRLYLKGLLLKELRTNKIKFKGTIRFKKTPNNIPLYLIAKHQSPPLKELIKIMLKKSDNITSDTIFKKLGAIFFDKQATWQTSSEAMKNILENKTNTTFKEMYLDDGSGLSHHNLITPRLLIKILDYAYHDQTIKQPFINALPHAGIDGTLEKRMLNLKNRVYAKTGNMTNSSSLAGYIKNKNQKTMAFAITVSSFLGKAKNMHKFQDKICEIIANN